MLTKDDKGGRGVSQKVTKDDKRGGGSGNPKIGWHNMWTAPYHYQCIGCPVQKLRIIQLWFMRSSIVFWAKCSKCVLWFKLTRLRNNVKPNSIFKRIFKVGCWIQHALSNPANISADVYFGLVSSSCQSAIDHAKFKQILLGHCLLH